MSQYKKNKRKMIRQYLDWLNNDTFTKEVAAFEYMKRNPYFISVATMYRMNLYSPMSSSFNPIAIDMKQLLQQIFLYTGFDIDKNSRKDNGSKFNYVEKTKFKNYGNVRDSIIKYYSTGKNYYYMSMYKPNKSEHACPLMVPNPCREVSKSAKDAKQEYPVDLNSFYADANALRWLEHLLPSMYIKLNPYMKQDDLKSALVNLIKQINNDVVVPNTSWKYSSYATPDAMLDNSDSTIDLTSPTFQPLKSLVALIMYDFIYIYKVIDTTKIKRILRFCVYPHITSKIKNEFERYFSSGGKSKEYQGVIFNEKHKKNNLDNVIARINGQYLDYIYPSKSQRLHRKLILKEHRANYSKENIMKQKNIITDVHKLLKNTAEYGYLLNYTGIIQLHCFSDQEYEKWSNDVFSLLEDEEYCNSIFSILLL